MSQRFIIYNFDITFWHFDVNSIRMESGYGYEQFITTKNTIKQKNLTYFCCQYLNNNIDAMITEQNIAKSSHDKHYFIL